MTLVALLRELRAIRDLLAGQAVEALDARQTAQLLGIGEATLYRLRAARKIPQPIRVGDSNALIRWRRADLLRYLATQRPMQ
jgi:predicted DNA-binding transcriptional regulator AlpA